MTVLLAASTTAALTLAACACVRTALLRHDAGRVRRRLGHRLTVGAVRLRGPAWLPARLDEMAVDVAPDLVWSAWVGAVILAGGWALTRQGIGIAVVASAALAGAPALAWLLLRHRADARAEASVPLMLDAIARSLRSGASLLQALGEAQLAVRGRLAADLAQATAAAERGLGVVRALDAWAASTRLPSVRLAVAALCLGAETGGAQARAVDGVALTVRQRLAVTGEANAQAAQARLSAVVIAIAPLAFSAFASASDPRIGAFLTSSPAGWLVLTVGLALDAAGAVWMARITRVR